MAVAGRLGKGTALLGEGNLERALVRQWIQFQVKQSINQLII